MIERGGVYWYEPDPVVGSEQGGPRPAVVLSREAINRSSPVVVAVPLTTHRGQRLYPSDVVIHAPEGGVPRDSVAMALHLRAIDRSRLGQRLGRLGPSTLQALERAVLQVLDIDPESL